MKIRSRKAFYPVLLLLLLSGAAQAEQVVFVKEYTYRASDIDSKVSSRTIALVEVKRALLEQLGTYLISETEVRNFKMTKDQVTTLTAGIVSAEILRETWNGTHYYLQARLTVDPREVAERIKALGSDRERTRELEAAQSRADDAWQEVEKLRRELDLAREDMQRQAGRQADYSRAVQELGTDDWFDGYRFTMRDGSSFIWKRYYERGENYCIDEPFGAVCIQMRDVASIKKGEYAPHTVVLSSPPADENVRRQAEQDRKAIERANEQAKQTAECAERARELRRKRDSDVSQDELRHFRSKCPDAEAVLRANERELRTPERRPSPRPRDRKTADMDRIIQNAKEGSFF